MKQGRPSDCSEVTRVESYQHVQSALDRGRSEYLSLRDQFGRAEQLAMQEYDKAILTLSSSFLGFSVAMVNLFSRQYEAERVLYVAWVLFSLAIVATLVSLYSSHAAFRRERDNLDVKYDLERRSILEAYGLLSSVALPPLAVREPGNPASAITLWSTKAAGVFFIAGIFTLVYFGSLNLKSVVSRSDNGSTSGPKAPQPAASPVEGPKTVK